MTSGNDNSPSRRHTITVERWDDDGDLNGSYLVALRVSGEADPIDARICATKDEAYDYARQIMTAHPSAVFHDKSGDGQP